MKFDYSDIINKMRPEHNGDDFSIRHPKMSIQDRAKIIAPFDALRGFDEAIDKENVIYAPYIYLSEDEHVGVRYREVFVNEVLRVNVMAQMC